MASFLAFLSIGLVHAGDEWRPLSSTEFKGGKIITMTDTPAGEEKEYGPVLFVPPTQTPEASNQIGAAIAQQLKSYGYLNVPAGIYDATVSGEDIGRSTLFSRVIYAGPWDEFYAQNEANAEKNGSVVDGAGIVRGIFSAVAYSAALLVGVPITAVADQVLTNGKGNIFKDDPTWFKSLDIDPDTKANPPKGVVAIKTSGNVKGKDRVNTWTLVFLNEDPTGKALPIDLTAQTITKALVQLMKPKSEITDEDRAAVDRIKAKIIAERESSAAAAKASLAAATSTASSQ